MCARRACVLCECMYIISNISHEQGITFTQSNIIPRRTTQRDGHLVTLDMVWELDWNGWKPKTMIQFKFLSSSSNQKLRIRLRYTQPKNETRFIIWGHSGQSVVKFYVRHYFMYLYRTSDNKLSCVNGIDSAHSVKNNARWCLQTKQCEFKFPVIIRFQKHRGQSFRELNGLAIEKCSKAQ